MSRHGEIITVESPVGSGITKRFKIVEQAVDPPNTIKRTLVPADTTDEDIPVGARLLDERETEGHLARASKPDPIVVGDTVRRKVSVTETDLEVIEKGSMKGTVDAQLKGNGKDKRFRVRFEDGTVDRFEAKDLALVW